MIGNLYSVASSSASSLYGNVGCVIRELILSKFPYDYFKYVNVSTEFAFRNMKRQFGSNRNTEISKRKKPYLIIQPTYQVPERDSFLQDIPLTKNIDDMQTSIDDRILLPVLKDKKYGYGLKYRINRDRIEFEVRVVVTHLHQQLDIYKALQNQVVWERPYSLKSALEAVVPKSMIIQMSKLCRMDVSDGESKIPIFLDHINDMSGYPITYKLRNASATDEYFLYYMHNMIVTFYDLSLEEGNRKNMVDDHYDLSFRVSAEFNMPGMYVLYGEKPSQDLQVDLTIANGNLEESSDYIPLYTISNLYNRYPRNRDGKLLYASFVFTTTREPNQVDDRVSFGGLFDDEKREVIHFFTSYRMEPNTFASVFVTRNRVELTEGKDYRVDWNRMEIVLPDPDEKATYRGILYLDMERFNSTVIDIREHGPFDHAIPESGTIQIDPPPTDSEQSTPSMGEPQPNMEAETRRASKSIQTWIPILQNTNVFNQKEQFVFEEDR